MLSVCVTLFCAVGFSQSLPLSEIGKPFSSPHLVVHWQVPKDIFPKTVSIYHLQPTQFSPVVVSNLMAIGRLTFHDQTISNANERVLESSDKTRALRLDSLAGRLDYTDTSVVHGGFTNVSVGVPDQSELLGLTTNLLPKLGLKFSDIRKKESSEPEFQFGEPEVMMFDLNSAPVTNIPQRSVFFRRSLDGGSFLINSREGNGWIYFGSHHAISRIVLKWPAMKRYQTFPTADFGTLEKWMSEGKARQAPLSMNDGEIDWKKVKSMTIEKAEICYFSKKDYVYPIASLWVIVDRGYDKVGVEISCPIIDETKQ